MAKESKYKFLHLKNRLLLTALIAMDNIDPKKEEVEIPTKFGEEPLSKDREYTNHYHIKEDSIGRKKIVENTNYMNIPIHKKDSKVRTHKEGLFEEVYTPGFSFTDFYKQRIEHEAFMKAVDKVGQGYENELTEMHRLTNQASKILTPESKIYQLNELQDLENTLQNFVGMDIDATFGKEISKEIRKSRNILEQYHNKEHGIRFSVIENYIRSGFSTESKMRKYDTKKNY